MPQLPVADLDAFRIAFGGGVVALLAPRRHRGFPGRAGRCRGPRPGPGASCTSIRSTSTRTRRSRSSLLTMAWGIAWGIIFAVAIDNLVDDRRSASAALGWREMLTLGVDRPAARAGGDGHRTADPPARPPLQRRRRRGDVRRRVGGRVRRRPGHRRFDRPVRGRPDADRRAAALGRPDPGHRGRPAGRGGRCRRLGGRGVLAPLPGADPGSRRARASPVARSWPSSWPAALLVAAALAAYLPGTGHQRRGPAGARRAWP